MTTTKYGKLVKTSKGNRENWLPRPNIGGVAFYEANQHTSIMGCKGSPSEK